MTVLGECTEFVLRRSALRLPVEYALAFSVSVVDGFTDYPGKLTTASFYSFRILLVNQKTGLDYHDIAAELVADIFDVFDAVCDDLLFVCAESSVKGPERIESHTDHIPLSTIFLEDTEVEII